MSDSEPTDTSASDDSDAQNTSLRNRSVRDNWWWSGTFWIVVGVAIVYVQWPSLTGQNDALVFNWILAGAGAVLVLMGLRELWTQYRGTRSATEPASHENEPTEDDTAG